MVDNTLRELPGIALSEAQAAWVKFFEDMEKDGFGEGQIILPLSGMFCASLTTVFITHIADLYGPQIGREMRDQLIRHLERSKEWL